MRLSAVFFTLGLFLLVLGGTMLIPAFAAFVEGERVLGFAFLGTILSISFVGGGLVLALRGPSRRSGVREAVMLLVLAWAVLPAFAMLPAYAAGWPGDLMSAYFEAVSALTTTGASQYQEASGAPAAILLWRSLLHWIGGFGGLLAAAAVLTGVMPTALPVQTVIVPQLEREALLARLLPMGRVLGPAYVLLTLGIIVFLMLSGLDAFDALCLGLSAIATGGTSAQGAEISLYGLAPVELVVVIAMMIGAISFATHTTALRGKINAYAKDPEAVWLMGVVGAAVLALWAFESTMDAWPAAFQTLSLVTTSGYIHEGAIGGLPPALIFTLVLLGGSIVSTAGGIKMMRLILLWRQSRRELSRLARPHSISHARIHGRPVTAAMLEPVWVYFIALVTAIMFLALILSLSLPSFEMAAGAAVAMLSNTGPAFHLAFPEAQGYGEFSPLALAAMSVGMILGRIEILALPILLTGSFWRF